MTDSQKVLNERLLCAAKDGDVEDVKKAIQAGASVNCKDNWGDTPLHRSAYLNKNHEVSDALIKSGSDIFAKDNLGETSLHLAAASNTNPKVSDLLIRAGLDISAEGKEGMTPLHYAAGFNKNAFVSDILIQAGCDIYAKDVQGRTPLDWSIRNVNKDVKKLIQSYTSGEKVVRQQEIFQQPSVELKQILANESSYESFDMRVMVCGKYGVGKTSLVKVLVGDQIPKERLPTDGISLLEGRCGLEIGSREWVMIDKDDYNANDIVYNRMLMPHTQKDTNEKSAAEEPSDNSDEAISREVDESFKPTGSKPKKQTVGASSPPPIPPIVRGITQSEIKTKLTKVELKKRLELALKNGTYKMMVGRLIFWDFGGQYVYYTTHQAFLTYRALYLVVFDDSKGLHEYEADEEIIPGQHGQPTSAGSWKFPGFANMKNRLFVMRTAE